MPIQTNESESFAKSIDVSVVPSPTGITVSGRVRWFNDEYEIPSVAIACPYTDDATYRVALCSTPPRLVLVEDDATPSDEVCYLARWRFTAPTDTCETVTIDVPRRVLVPRPPTVRDIPLVETVEEPVLEPVIVETEDGPAVVLDEQGNPRMRPVVDGEGNPVTRPVERQVVLDGEPQFETITIPPDPLPEPTVHAVSATPVLPASTPERAASRKKRRRIRDLTQACRALKDAGTTYEGMGPDDRRKVQELTALLAGVPLAVP